MRKNRKLTQEFLILSILCLLLLTACGGKKEEQPEGGQSSGQGTESRQFLDENSGVQWDVAVDRSNFPDVAAQIDGGTFLGMQFYKGEPVQLWASEPREGNVVTVYLYRKDGTEEVVREKVDLNQTRTGGYLDEQGNYYGINRNAATKIDAAGQALFSATAGNGGYDSIEEICSTPGGKTVVLARIEEPETSYMIPTLMELGQDKKLTKVELEAVRSHTAGNMPSYVSHLGAWGEDLLLLDKDYIYRIDLQAGKLTQVVSLEQTSYVSQKNSPLEYQEDIRAVSIPESGRIELLWAYPSGKGRCENLAFKDIRDMAKEREAITLSGWNIDPWLREQVVKFNNANDKYYIKIETASDNYNAMYEFRVNLNIEIATGKGPEILFGSNMIDSPDSLIEKGVLMDLAPLMKQSGIKEEDYFPLTFARWRTKDSIYAVFYQAYAEDYLIKADVLGDVENLNMETFLDALLAYPERAALNSFGCSAKNNLRDFLKGSDSLYGMINWENGTCDFSKELFTKMVEAAERYQFSMAKDYPVIMEQRMTWPFSYDFKTDAEYAEEGYIPAFYLFEDGTHPILLPGKDRTLYINANSAHPEAAWEFLKLVLSEEAQETLYTIDHNNQNIPVMKKVFLSEAQAIMDNEKPIWMTYELTQERLDAFAAYLEDTRDLSWKTETIVEIIVEEADRYFNKVKDLQQVQEAVQNRVQLYLDERGGSR